MLPVSASFHRALMQPAQEEVARVLLETMLLADPRDSRTAKLDGRRGQHRGRRQGALIRQVTGAVRVGRLREYAGSGRGPTSS